jgi:hypothetical protein
MTAAGTLGDAARARDLARRYLEEFPNGLSAGDARRVLGASARP